MADRVALTIQPTTRAGLTEVFATPSANNHVFDNSSHKVVLHVKNVGASPINVTVVTPGTVDGQAIADLVVAVPATTGDKIIGPFPAAVYDQTSVSPAITTAVLVNFSAQTDVTVAAVQLGTLSY